MIMADRFDLIAIGGDGDVCWAAAARWPMRKADLPVSDCLIWRTSEIRPAGVRELATDEFALLLP